MLGTGSDFTTDSGGAGPLPSFARQDNRILDSFPRYQL